jgi:catechol 2,3-dioxygenase-like lactoylglutathione lyase family enzyme
MIGYVTIGALDTEASGKFYDAVLGVLGDERKFVDGDWIGWGPKSEGKDSHYVYVCKPFNQEPARAGNGIMLAFVACSQDEVNAAYAAGMANGGSDEGKPGPRPADSTSFYAAYLRDPTGNKLCIYFKR